MPSLITHHIFSKDLLKKLNKDELNKFDKELTIYHTFAQSHDYLFYYRFNPKYSKTIKKLGHYAHHHNTQDYLINIIKEIKNNKLENNQQVIAYLYGSITHYVLDTTCHPYIFYKTGVYRKKEKNTKKYHGKHNEIEKNIDAIYYEKNTNKKYYKCNISKEIIKKPIFNKELLNTINNVYKKTYNKDNIGFYYYKGIIQAKIAYNIFFKDYFGIKKSLYKLINLLSLNKNKHLSTYSTYIKNPNIKYLNTEKKEWNHPSDPSIKYNYSFEELYNQSLNKSLKIIKEVNKIIYENKNIEELLEFIPDLDYSTGTIIKDKKEMRYFEF